MLHHHLDLERGLELAKRMESLNLFWLEEVVPAKPVENLAKINAAAKMPKKPVEKASTAVVVSCLTSRQER